MKKHTSNTEETKLNNGISEFNPKNLPNEKVEDSGNSQMGLQNEREVI